VKEREGEREGRDGGRGEREKEGKERGSEVERTVTGLQDVTLVFVSAAINEQTMNIPN
jgi:hypothetical protein